MKKLALLMLALAGTAHAQYCPIPGNPCGGSGAASQSAVNGATGAGNPIDVTNGNKYQLETDVQWGGELGLQFRRHYNSLAGQSRELGRGWTHEFSTTLSRTESTDSKGATDRSIEVRQADGRVIAFVPLGAPRNSVQRYVSRPAGYGVVEESLDQIERLRAGKRNLVGVTSEDAKTLRPWVWRWIGGRRVEFDGDGRTRRIATPAAERLDVDYDSLGRLRRVGDAHGRVLGFDYWDDAAERLGAFGDKSAGANAGANARGRLKSLITPEGGRIAFGYDTRGMLSAVTYADGTTTRYEYVDAAGQPRLAKITGRDGKLVGVYGYDAQGRANSSSADGGMHKVELEYRAPAKPGGTGETWLRNARGEVSVYRWVYQEGNNEARLVEAIGAGCATCAPTNRRYGFGENGRVARTEMLVAPTIDHVGALPDDPLAVRTADIVETDALGRRTARWREAGGRRELVERWSYQSTDDPAEPPALIERPSVAPGRSYRAEIRYDAAQRPLSLRETGFEPDGTALQRETTFAYTNGRLTSVDGPLPGSADQSLFEYDERGLLRTRTSPGGQRETREYDELGRVLRVTPADGVALAFEYDAAGRATSIERAGRKQATWYDDAGRIGGTLDSLGQRLTFEYGAADTLTAIVDSQGNRIEIERDAEGQPQVSRLLNPDRSIAVERRVVLNTLLPQSLNVAARADIDTALRLPTHESYEAAPAALAPVLGIAYANREALRREVRDLRGLVSRYDYDDFGRLVRIENPDSGVTTFDYDAGDRLVRATDASARTRVFGYDDADRVTSLDAGSEHIAIDYAANGRPQRIVSGASEDRFVYDAAAQLTEHERVIDGHAYSIRYGYDALGRVDTKTLPDGQKLRFRYNGPMHERPGLLAGIERVGWFGSTPIVSGLNDPDDRFARSSFTLANGLPFVRELNARGELVKLGTPGVAQLDITRDANGRVAETKGAAVFGFDYDSEGRVSGSATSFGGPLEAVGMSYDPSSNPLARVVQGRLSRYAIDPASNRIVAEQTTDGRRVEYRYDPAGRLTQRGDLRFDYDGLGRLAKVSRADQPLAEYGYNALGERVKKVTHDGRDITTHYLYEDGVVVAEATVGRKELRQYVWLDSRPVAMLDDDALYALHSDWRGAPLVATDADRHVVWRAGQGAVTSASIATGLDVPLRGSSQYFDRETGLHYNLTRYFDPESQRFTTPDTLGQAGGLNLYAFAGGDPVNFVDTLGTQQSLPPDTNVTNWSFNERLKYVLQQAIPQVPGEIGEQLRAMIQPANLAIVAGIFAVWGVAQLTPAGWIADAVLGVLGYIFLGEAIVRLAGVVIDTYSRTRNARCIRDLNLAANEFAKVAAEVAINLGQAGAVKLARLMGKFFRNARRSGAWDLNQFERGHVIEEALGHNTPTNNYPVIDRWTAAGGIGTSIKSIDLNASTYQTASRLRSLIKGYIDDLSAFNGTLHGGLNTRGLIRARELEIAIPNAPNATQQQVITQMIQYAAGLQPPVTVRIIVFP